MPKYIAEDQRSRSIDMNNGGGQSTRRYVMRDYTEADDAYVALREYAPPSITIYGFVMNRTGIKVTPDFSDPQATLYRGDVTYKSETMDGSTANKTSGGGGGGGGDSDLPKNREIGRGQDPKKDKIDPDETSKVWFTFGTRSKTVTQNLGDVRAAKNAEGQWEQAANNFKFINKDADDVQPEGVIVQDGTMFMHLQVVLTPSQTSPAFYKAAREALMAVNKNQFAFAFPSGTVQFQGIDIEEMVNGNFKVIYHFEYRPLTFAKSFFPKANGIGFLMTGDRPTDDLNFDGFDYTWLSWQDTDVEIKENDSGESVRTYNRVVDSINLAQVYPRVAFGSNECLKHCKKPEGETNPWSL